jgi:uncharacterized protein with HEPN domain
MFMTLSMLLSLLLLIFETFRSYQSQTVVKLAVERKLEVIGEALNHAMKLDPQLPITSKHNIV